MMSLRGARVGCSTTFRTGLSLFVGGLAASVTFGLVLPTPATEVLLVPLEVFKLAELVFRLRLRLRLSTEFRSKSCRRNGMSPSSGLVGLLGVVPRLPLASPPLPAEKVV